MIVSLPPVSQRGPENTIVNSLLATTFVLCDHWHDFIGPRTLMYCPTLALYSYRTRPLLSWCASPQMRLSTSPQLPFACSTNATCL